MEPSTSHPLLGLDSSYNTSEATFNQVLFKGGCIYQHNILHINYTTYNLNHGQDTFNSNSNHHDIMMLAGRHEEDPDMASDHFYYAHIIGIYHANMQYIGLGLKDYHTHQLDFLHIQWFELVLPNANCGGVLLNMLWLVPVNNEDAFSFVDPMEVQRGCHLIPAFAKGRLDPSGAAPSSVSQDANAWRYYYVNK